MAKVVTFETNESVSEVLDEVLRWRGIDHASHYVRRRHNQPVKFFMDTIRMHRPRLVITSWKDIGPSVIAASRAVQPRPAVWLFTGYDEDLLNEQGALVAVDRLFSKPFAITHIAAEALEFLGSDPGGRALP